MSTIVDILTTMNEAQFHPLAEIFPVMEGQEFADFVADIKANGLREEIWTHEGKIIDGRNRYRACLEAGVEPTFREWDGKGDLLGFILSLNVHRRHLTPSQRAMVAARARDVYDREAKERMQEGGRNKGMVTLPSPKAGAARDKAGKALQVSGSYVDRATKVLEKGTPELIKAVDESRMSVTTAAILASEPEEVQRAECEKPRRNRTYEPLSKPSASRGGEPERAAGKTEVGIDRAHEAIGCLIRIPKNDRFRKRGFQIVTDWIKQNQ